MDQLLNALHLHNWYALAALLLTLGVQVFRKAPWSSDLWQKIPNGWRWLLPVLSGAITGFTQAFAAGLDLPAAVLAAIGGAIGISIPAMGINSLLTESPVKWNGGAGGLPPALALLLVTCFALNTSACSAPAEDPELDPVFVLLCADIDPGEPPHPCCAGFALGNQVVTANHCVPTDHATLVTRRQWVETSAASEPGLVVARDAGRDIAWLTAALDGPGLTQGGPVALGDPVRVLTAWGARAGTAYERAGAFWRTNADTDLGDSGAAVVNARGRAVGVLTQCLTADGKECDMGTGIFVELP